MPEHAEAEGLLALMLLSDARRAARTGPCGELVPLEAQDRTRWNRAQLDEGTALVERALRRGAVGPYQVQAAIAAVHGAAATFAATDWPQILALYDLLLRMTDSPVVALNRAVALAMVHGPAPGLAEVERLAASGRLSQGHRLDAVRAHLSKLAGDRAAAVRYYGMAADRARNAAERTYLRGKLDRLSAS